MAPKREFVDPPDAILARVRALCDGFPETSLREMSRGTRLWRIRGNTFAYLGSEVQGGRVVTAVTFRAEGADLDALLHVGHPFYQGWGGGLVAMVLDDDTDWDEVAEVLADSYCICAPKKLAVLVEGRVTPGQ